jgi:hypothetical protein
MSARTNWLSLGTIFLWHENVKPIVNGVELAASAAYNLPANAATQQYLNLFPDRSSWRARAIRRPS